MKALDLALGLRVAHRAKHDPNALLEQKHHEPRQPRRSLRAPPGGAVVHQHRGRHAVALEATNQRRADARRLQREQRGEADHKPTVVIQHAERVTPVPVRERIGPLRIHLPEVIGRRMREALQRRRRRAIESRPALALDPPIDGPRCEPVPFGGHKRRQFGPTPAKVGPQLAEPLDHGGRRPVGTVMRSTTLIGEHGDGPGRGLATQPLVTGRPTNAEGPAGLADRRSPAPDGQHKLDSLIAHIGLQPGHRPHSPRARPYPMLSAMCCRHCKPCPVVGHFSRPWAA